MAEMNGLDYLLLAIIGFSILNGLARGALRMVSSLLAFILGIYAASTWHEQVAAVARSLLGISATVSIAVGYVLAFLVLFVAVELTGQRLLELLAWVHLALIDRLAGAAVGAVFGLILAGLNIMLLTAVLPANYPLLQRSTFAPKILAYDRELIDYVPPYFKQVYQDKRDQLARYWNSGHADTPAAQASAR